jgi:hypothetical protein
MSRLTFRKTGFPCGRSRKNRFPLWPALLALLLIALVLLIVVSADGQTQDIRRGTGGGGGGGSATNLTPWPSDIDAANHNLNNAGTVNAGSLVGRLTNNGGMLLRTYPADTATTIMLTSTNGALNVLASDGSPGDVFGNQAVMNGQGSFGSRVVVKSPGLGDDVFIQTLDTSVSFMDSTAHPFSARIYLSGTGIVATAFSGNLNASQLASGTVPAARLPALTGAITTSAGSAATSLGSFSSANLLGALTDETGSGPAVFATSPSLTTPTIGVATATSVNKWALTAPTTAATLTAGGDNLTYTMPSSSQTIVGTTSTDTLQNKTLTTPTIASFVNATHNHQNAAGGGTLDGAVIGSGTVVAARLGITLAPSFATLTDGATITWTADATKDVQNATVTLGGNRTLAFASTANGMSGTLIVKQDGTGTRTLTLPAGSKVINGGSGAITLSTAANAVDVLTWIYDGTSYYWTYGKNFN